MNDIPFSSGAERFTRRAAIGTALAASGAAALGATLAEVAPQATPAPTARSAKRYDMKKSINLWAFPYPEKMSLVQCLQLAKDAGFDGIEIHGETGALRFRFEDMNHLDYWDATADTGTKDAAAAKDEPGKKEEAVKKDGAK